MYAASLNPRQAVNSNLRKRRFYLEEGLLSTSIDSDLDTGPVVLASAAEQANIATDRYLWGCDLNSISCADASSRKSMLYWFHACPVAVYTEPPFSQWGWVQQGTTRLH